MSEICINDHRNEQAKSFDISATVHMYRRDILEFGYIMPETEQRGFDEELTYIAEGINRSFYTRFKLNCVDNQLMYFDNGQWRPYISSLNKGIEVAIQEAEIDNRKTFIVDMRRDDLVIALKLQGLKVGEKISWKSEYPYAQDRLYGEEFIQSVGLQYKRKMGFIYQATKDADGNVILESQSVDNSDTEAFGAAMSKESMSIHDMRAAYDEVMSKKYKGYFYAGRRIQPGGKKENAWDLILEHADLVTYLMEGIKNLAYQTSVNGEKLDEEKKLLTYGVWAALRQRLDTQILHTVKRDSLSPYPQQIYQEVQQALVLFSQRKEVLTGCGGSIKGLSDILANSDPKEVFTDIFGEDGPEKWSWKKGVCRVEKCPTRPGQTEVGPCDVCRCCQRWFDKGRDPEKLYKGLTVATKEIVTQHSSNKTVTKISRVKAAEK